MKRNFFILFSVSVMFFIVFTPIVFANSPTVIGEDKAGGYQYKVIKDQDTFTWQIGHQDNTYTVIENEDNGEDLEFFRVTIQDIGMEIYQIIISALYFLIVMVTTILFYKKKNKQISKISRAIIAVLAGIALYYTIINSYDLNVAFRDANFYYMKLTD